MLSSMLTTYGLATEFYNELSDISHIIGNMKDEGQEFLIST